MEKDFFNHLAPNFSKFLIFKWFFCHVLDYVVLICINFAARQRYFVQLCARRSDVRKAGGIEMASAHYTKRTYTNRFKGTSSGSCKPPETIRRVDEHVKSKDIGTSNQGTRRECIQKSFTGLPDQPSRKEPVTTIVAQKFSTSNQPSGKDGKPVIPEPPQKSDIKPDAGCKAPYSDGQPPLHKINSSKQEYGKPQPNFPYGMSGKQKNYTWKIIAGVVLLVSAIAVSSVSGCLYDNDKL